MFSGRPAGDMRKRVSVRSTGFSLILRLRHQPKGCTLEQVRLT